MPVCRQPLPRRKVTSRRYHPLDRYARSARRLLGTSLRLAPLRLMGGGGTANSLLPFPAHPLSGSRFSFTVPLARQSDK